MASLRVVERARVSPPPGLAPPSDLTLTYFDDMWQHLAPPTQRLLFYRYNGATQDFRDYHFSVFQSSLSLALAIFYPIAGRLVPVTKDGADDHVIRYSDGDSVPVTLVESEYSDFDRLVGNHLKNSEDLYPFAPELVSVSPDEYLETKLLMPLFAVQVTVFPFSGVCVGITLNHVVADGSSATSFLRTWASISKSGGVDVETSRQNLPLYDRTLVGDHQEELKHIWRDDIKKIVQSFDLDHPNRHRLDRVLRGTFVLSRAHIDGLRRLSTSSGYDVGPRPSTYTVATAYAWLCWTRSCHVADDELVNFVFTVDCRSRLSPPVPAAYFGNCIGVAFAGASARELNRKNGFAVAAEAIHKTIRGLGGENAMDTVYWIPRWIQIANKQVLLVASSPRFRVYEADFGWGRPHKVELVSIEKSGAISLAESRDEEGGVEIGLVGPDVEMERFASIFEEGLQNLVHEVGIE